MTKPSKSPAATGKTRSWARRLLSRLRPRLPRSLGGQIIMLVVLTLMISQIINLVLVAGERVDAFRRGAVGPLVNQTAIAVDLLRDADPQTRQRLLRALSGPDRRFRIAQGPLVRDRFHPPFSRGIKDRLERATGSEVRVEARFFDGDTDFDDYREELRDRWSGILNDNDRPRFLSRAERREQRREDFDRQAFKVDRLLVSVALEDGRWLNTEWQLPKRDLDWLKASLRSNFILALVLSLVAFVIVRRVTKPIKALANAAEELGRGADVPPLREAGPREIRQATSAFNAMQDRLTRFVNDRTQMLAAISHDLRTPITSLRLRAELLDDEEARDNMVRTLEEMQAMTESVLSFSRDEATNEATERVDLRALLQDCVDMLDDGERDIALNAPLAVQMSARPLALKRAFGNLIENALKYGDAARILLSEQSGQAVIAILDQGPGIPEERIEEMFKPFARLESSRNRETGGTGLGLAIARSVARSHGGDITMENAAEGGLIVKVTLPLG